MDRRFPETPVKGNWGRFYVLISMRLTTGRYERAISLSYEEGVPKHEVPAMIHLSRRGEAGIARGTPWMPGDVVADFAKLPGFSIRHGLLYGSDPDPRLLVHSVLFGFRDVLGVPDPAFLAIGGMSVSSRWNFRSEYVEQERPPF